jgi:RHS repeat-associated protein
VLEERLGTSATLDRQFVWGLRYIDDLTLRDRFSSGALSDRFFALQDANWNVTAIVGKPGSGWAAEERYRYTAYGVPTFMNASFTPITGSTHDWETLFVAYHFDSESGLFLTRQRYLNDAVGNWATRDPFGYDYAGPNLYLYVFSSPISYIDPHGTQAVLPGGGVGTVPSSPGFAGTSAQSGPAPSGIYIPSTYMDMGPVNGFGLPLPTPVPGDLDYKPPSIQAPGYVIPSKVFPPPPLGFPPIPLPGQAIPAPPGRLLPPIKGPPRHGYGDCTPDEFHSLNRVVHAWCDLERSCKEIKCCPPFVQPNPPCIDATRLYYAGLFCAEARFRLMVRCFRGGDETHQNEYGRVVETLSGCIKKLKECQCF